ncbi:MAG: hypothetical protein U0800_14700 [Isosphaeraceae bacterium]
MSDANQTLRAQLDANTTYLRDGLFAEMGRPNTLDRGRPLQFEADPWSKGITSCAKG